jgi:hypothetical protein
VIPVILDKRKTAIRAGHAFNRLIGYLEGDASLGEFLPASKDQKFTDILNYTTSSLDKQFAKKKCMAVRTHGVTDLRSAAIEMNAVSSRNTRCKDPAFHFVLAWPEFERPHAGAIFDAAEHAIQALGLAEHQYVLAIHIDTDNIHCHAAVNRIHPQTFKSRNIEWANKTIHRAARESEIKHGWFHDNGIYVIQLDEQNNKTIVLNPEHNPASRLSRQGKQARALPAWHDPESLESWLKSKVAKALSAELPQLGGWHELHAWLNNYGISLFDSGGGGMRLRNSSQETGEIIDLPASKGLRVLKRKELEARWGKFTRASDQTPSEQFPASGIAKESRIAAPSNTRSENRRQMREERLEQRAAARADLRRRFSQYQLFVREGDAAYFERLKEIRRERQHSIYTTDAQANAKRAVVRDFHKTDLRGSLIKMAAIYLESDRLKLEAEAVFREKRKSLQASRVPSLGWREWLYEQSNLGDQAALSALRGIVYQARRDEKRKKVSDPAPVKGDEINSTKQYREILSRLIDAERKEIAIRSARSDALRPFEVDALLAQYVGLIWHVTGNGNVIYSNHAAGHVFTDRGNRITFDRELVSDEDILLALAHAQQKFGRQVTLTGDDPVFLARMACLADDMGMAVLNPDLQSAIEEHRRKRSQMIPGALSIAPSVEEKMLPSSIGNPIPSDDPDVQVVQEQLRELVLAIDPNAEFVIPDTSNSQRIYSGPIVATCPIPASGRGFAQHIGRGVYALHAGSAPESGNSTTINVQYHDGLTHVTFPEVGRGKEI